MNAEYTAVLKQDGEWWIGWVEEVPGVNCQERTKADLLTSLKEVLSEAIREGQQTERVNRDVQNKSHVPEHRDNC